MTSALLSKGAHVNSAANGNTAGGTALMCAAINGTTEAVKLLMEGGADKTMKNKWGETALDCALQYRCKNFRFRQIWCIIKNKLVVSSSSSSSSSSS